MKNFVAAIISFITIVSSVQAQDTLLKRDHTRVVIQKQDRVHQEDHLYFQDGKLYQMRQGLRKEVKSPIELKNGTVVNPDGSYVLQNQSRLRMSNGECMDMLGSIYKNQNMFNQRRSMNDSEMRKQRDMKNAGKRYTKDASKGD